MLARYLALSEVPRPAYQVGPGEGEGEPERDLGGKDHAKAWGGTQAGSCCRALSLSPLLALPAWRVRAAEAGHVPGSPSPRDLSPPCCASPPYSDMHTHHTATLARCLESAADSLSAAPERSLPLLPSCFSLCVTSSPLSVPNLQSWSPPHPLSLSHYLLASSSPIPEPILSDRAGGSGEGRGMERERGAHGSSGIPLA